MRLEKLRDYLRSVRKFDAETYIDAKVELINRFFSDNNLDACVLGISGGVDSAVVYKLLRKASQVEGSPIKKVMALILPIECDGTTGQDEAVYFAKKVVGDDFDNKTCYLSEITRLYKNFFAAPTPWTQGQIASIVRTPMLYGEAAYLQQKGYKSIVVGTTNRDEGSYIGFYGKASDAMVDLQPIGDLHKSEVYQVAKLLGVPQEIIDRAPVGDVFDGSTDEHTIGAPYWAVEMEIQFKEYALDNHDTIMDILKEMPEEDKKQWRVYRNNIEAIHAKNKHKYEVGLPSHFLDVMPRCVEGGWDN